MSKKTSVAALALAAAALVVPVAAASARPSAHPSAGPSPAVNTCTNAGAGATLVHYCISPEGFVVEYNAGTSLRHLDGQLEGYTLCWTGGGAKSYANVGITTNFGAPIQTGVNPLTIARTTTDGKFQLSQQFFTDTQNGGVRIQMSLKNLTASTITGVKISRLADMDADADSVNATLVATDSATQVSSASKIGVTARPLSYSIPHGANVETYSTVSSNFSVNLSSCSPVAPVVSPNFGIDGIARVDYTLGNVNAGATKLVKLAYDRA